MRLPSLGYQLAGVLGGALALLISVALFRRFHTSTAISVCVLLALVVTFVAVLVAPETSQVDLKNERPEDAGRRELAGASGRR
ncbi:MAG: hypothetical protein NVSMB13_06400 [Mycobacteriales bacterium]